MKTPIELADTQQGWAKLQRSTLDSPMMKNPILLQIYVWSILKANHQPKWFSIRIGKGYKEVYCDVGQFITGRNRAADELGMPGSTWYTNIIKLKEYGYLEIESNSHYSLITIVNYGGAAPDVQPLEQQKKKEKNNKKTAKEQPKNTNNNYKNEKKKKKEKNYKEVFLKNSHFLSSQESKSEEVIEEDSQGTKQIYEYVIQTIDDGLPDVASIPQQLSLKDFKLVFNQYDISDIIRKLKELDTWKDTKYQKSVANILSTFLKNDKDIVPLLVWEKNRVLVTEPIYIDVKELQHYFNEVKDLSIWQKSPYGSSEEDKFYFIKDYLKWLKMFKIHERFKRLIPFSLEEAIDFEQQYEGFWLSDFDEAELYYSPYLNKHTSMLGFLKEHFDRINEEFD